MGMVKRCKRSLRLDIDTLDFRALPMHTENRHCNSNFPCAQNLHGSMHTENDLSTSRALAGRF